MSVRNTNKSHSSNAARPSNKLLSIWPTIIVRLIHCVKLFKGNVLKLRRKNSIRIIDYSTMICKTYKNVQNAEEKRSLINCYKLYIFETFDTLFKSYITNENWLSASSNILHIFKTFKRLTNEVKMENNGLLQIGYNRNF